MLFNFDGYPITFDHASLSQRLREKFAAAADAKDLLRHIDFETHIANSADVQRSTPQQHVLKVLEENVPDIKPQTLLISTMMVMGPLFQERITLTHTAVQLYRAVDVAVRNPEKAALQSPEMAQAFMAAMICNAQQMLAARKTGYDVHPNSIRSVAEEMAKITALIHSKKLRSDASQLEALFIDTAMQVQRVHRKPGGSGFFTKNR